MVAFAVDCLWQYIKSNPGLGSDGRVGVDYSNIRRLHANLGELAVAIPSYDVLVGAESKVSDRRHLSELRIPGFGCPQHRLRNYTPGAQGMDLYVREGFRYIRQKSKLECSYHESRVFHICKRLSDFYVCVFYRNPGHDGSLYDCLVESMARMQSVDDKAVFVFDCDANAHRCEWLESVSPTDRQGRDALYFCNLSGCKQLVRCPTYIAGNRLNLVMSDDPDIADVVLELH